MRLIELEITNVRGIRHLLLRPEGQSLLIWGPNGSGKSTVVDSLDFLFTGNISRLTGKGTAGIRLDKHGPHITVKPADAEVRGLVELPAGEVVELRRNMKDKKLVYDEQYTEPLTRVLDAAQQGQYVLTRREILKYVTADQRTRATQVQELLRLDELEKIRKALQGASNKLTKEEKLGSSSLSSREVDAARALGIALFDADAALEVTNELRAQLGAGPIDTLTSDRVREGVHQPTGASGGPLPGLVRLQDDLEAMTGLLERDPHFLERNTALHGVLDEFHGDPDMQRSFRRRELLKYGKQELADDGDCPLCGADFEAGDLQSRIDAELEKVKKAGRVLKELKEFTSELPQMAHALHVRLQRIVDGASAEGIGADGEEGLRGWLTALEGQEAALRKPVSMYKQLVPAGQGLVAAAPDGAVEALGALREAVEASIAAASAAGEGPEALEAWTALTRFEDHLGGLEREREMLRRTRVAAQRAKALFDAFEAERSRVLTELYQHVGARFTELYRTLNADDEGDMEAALAPKGAGLDFVVDFHGHGMHPPHALHSEGHQDSMGLCLYLALSEWISRGLLNLTVLDDVVMSVDASHRKAMCNLFKQAFPDRQFLITTHDRAWMNQLRHLSVFPRKNIVEFTAWQLTTGPRVTEERSLWERIDGALERSDVTSAAHMLRRGSEERFALLADKLGASVRYRLDGRVDLGEYLRGVQRRLTVLLRTAKAAASSWDDRETLDTLKEFESQLKQVNQRINMEAWAVNANVHYNNWASFSAADLRDVVDAFRDLWSLLECVRCVGVIRVVRDGHVDNSVTCDCGQFRWNLVKKS